MYKRIINQTFLPVFENKMALMKALLIPTLLLVILSKLPQIYDKSLLVGISTSICSFLLYITMAITTHRIILLGQDSIPTWGLFKFAWREVSFLMTSFFIGIIVTAICFIGLIMTDFLSAHGEIAFIPTAVAVFLALIVFSRCSLALPAIAIEKEITIGEAWNYTKKYRLLTFFTIIIFPAIITTLVGLVYGLAIGFLSKLISPHLDMLYPVLDAFITVFVVSALSATYQVIKEDHPEYFISKKRKQNEVLLTNNNEQHTINPNEFEINFESLKQELIKQYESLGFTNTVVDKEDSWMVKNPENQNAYVALSLKDNEYKIETYNVKGANIEAFLPAKQEVK